MEVNQTVVDKERVVLLEELGLDSEMVENIPTDLTPKMREALQSWALTLPDSKF